MSSLNSVKSVEPHAISTASGGQYRAKPQFIAEGVETGHGARQSQLAVMVQSDLHGNVESARESGRRLALRQVCK